LVDLFNSAFNAMPIDLGVLTPGGVGGSDTPYQPQSDAGVTTPGALSPATGQLAGACAAGGNVNADGTRSAQTWECGAAAPGSNAEAVIDLYHGTNKAGAANIRANGVNTAHSSRPMDFGNGFYTTLDAGQANDWATSRYGANGEVLHFRIPVSQLAALNSTTLSEGGVLGDLVRYFRNGGNENAFDMISGPMLGNVKPFMNGADPRWWGNQVVFFGGTGSILDAGLQ
jgi:hypothetical protein